MMPAIERILMESQTAMFIDSDPELITILPRRTQVPDGAGGWTNVETFNNTPIKVRLIPQSDKVPEVTPMEGRRKATEYVLLALPGTDVQRYDRFSWRDQVWQVDQIHDKPEYELKGDVVLYVGDN